MLYFMHTQITSIEFNNCCLEESSSTRLWIVMSSLTSLHHLNIKSSSLALPHQPSTSLPLVMSLEGRSLTSDSYTGVIGSLPGLQTLGSREHAIHLTNPDADIAQISVGLRHTATSVTEIWLNGKDAIQPGVSDDSLISLCDVIRVRVTSLKIITLCNMKIDGNISVKLIEACRTISTMRELG